MNDGLRYSVPFFQVPNELLEDERTSVYHIAVFAALAMHANHDRRAWPSVNRLSKLTGVSRRKVVSVIQEVQDFGWLKVSQRWDAERGGNTSNMYELQPSLQGSAHGALGVVHSMHGVGACGAPEPDSSEPDSSEPKKSAKPRHPTLDVPMNQTRYDNLCQKYRQAAVDDYMERVKDWAASKGKRIVDYACAAAGWLKRDNVPQKIGYQIERPADPRTVCPTCKGRVVSPEVDEAFCQECGRAWKLKANKWEGISHEQVRGG